MVFFDEGCCGYGPVRQSSNPKGAKAFVQMGVREEEPKDEDEVTQVMPGLPASDLGPGDGADGGFDRYVGIRRVR